MALRRIELQGALRSLRRRPGFAIACVLALAASWSPARRAAAVDPGVAPHRD